MVDTSQPDRRAGRQRQERQERRAEVTNASDTDPTTNTNTLEGNPILPMEPAEFFTREEWLTELLEVFHENLEPLQMNHDVEGIRQLIDWLAENLGADDELAQASPRTLPSEDRAAAHQNAATTRLANRLSRAFRRLDRLEARVPEGDEPLNRMESYEQESYEQESHERGDYERSDYEQSDYEQSDYQRGDYQRGDYQRGDYQWGTRSYRRDGDSIDTDTLQANGNTNQGRLSAEPILLDPEGSQIHSPTSELRVMYRYFVVPSKPSHD
ncbi:uncharacterized protein Triagg1_6912 [Trichoderma aggressivum f. europaeum]|uniref:Uncharacterized protein n=1 Tax=Trichoderma aggressivum f. europaeum TaxID=173218 RepID=A0AAE1ID45_9HYPO|nr:hypothetical protein Triagg1_6912 [Trichoderma aggressivum f. europaeum]